jgi:2-aminoadipate transaminase
MSPALQYGWAEGQVELRSWIAARLNARGARVRADDILVTSGGQQAISIAIDLLYRRPGAIGVEAASYPAALDLFRGRRLALASMTDGRACYVMPGLNNPTGQRLSKQERRDLLARGAAVIEDDAYGELVFDGAPAPLLLRDAPDRVFHVGTLSKTLCPGLRVGWLVVPRRQRDRARRVKERLDLQANGLAQAIVSDYLQRVDFDDRLRKLRRYYAARAERLARELRRALPSWRFALPEGGFCLWVDTNERVDERRFAEIAIEEGVSFDPGSSFLGEGQPSTTWIRVCFSSVEADRFRDGARRLASAWSRVTQRP